ncbi:glycosyltransferase [Ramlibacter henchirensis]|nr:glycosyltransferase [Ramlibacter henchirensis]
MNSALMHREPAVAVVLPAYNEEATIRDTIQGFSAALPKARIVVIDNNSRDATAAVARETLLQLGADGLVISEVRQGKGNAVRRAFLEVDADIYILSDADLTYPPERAIDLLRPIIENRADMVVGDRHSGGEYARENKRSLHGFGNRLVQQLVNSLFNAKLVDIMSGYRAFSREFVKNYPILVEGFEVETDLTLHALHRRYRVMEVPIEYRDRPAGSVSKLNTVRDGAKVLFTIAQILRYYRPLFFFVLLAVCFSGLGLIAGYPVIDEYIQTQFVSRLPLAVLATGLQLVAVISLAIGLILDAVSHQQAFNYELGLLRYRKSAPSRP